MLQSGDSLSSGEVAGGIYAADDGALLFTSEKPDFNVFVPTNSQGTEGYLYSTWEAALLELANSYRMERYVW